MPRPPVLTQSLYQEIRDRILHGDFLPGVKLPTEGELCARFEVSRPVVRAALEHLRAEGLITTRRGSGSFVAEIPCPPATPAPLIRSVRDLNQLLEFRALIEGEMAALAARGRTDADLAELRSAVEALDSLEPADDIAARADFRFHEAMARATGNAVAFFTYRSLEPHILVGMTLGRGLALFFQAETLPQVKAEHAAILDAIHNGDGDRARIAMRAHIDGYRRRLMNG